MPTFRRPLVPFALVTIALIVGACIGGAPSASPPGSGSPSGEPSAQPTADPGTVDHATGATDILLRYEVGGGFMMPAFIAVEAPIFTLYGDGTIVFRDVFSDPPPAQGTVVPGIPFRTTRLDEPRIQELLRFALDDGRLGVARARYENHMVADAPTTTFTINAGGVSKQVSAYALGLDVEGSPDGLILAALNALAERLGNFDEGKTLPTAPYVPDAYRGVLFDNNGFGAPDTRAWPWTDLAPADFTTDPKNPDSFFLSRTMSAADLAVFTLSGIEGGFMGMTVNGPGDGKIYSFSLRPLLPGETS